MQYDGVIFTKIYYPYLLGRNLGVLKWKPESLMTIDFRIVIPKNLDDNIYYFELYVSYSSWFI